MDAQQQEPSRMDQVKGQAGETMDQVKSQAGEAMGEVKDKAGEATDKAQGYMRDMMDQRSHQAGQWLSKTGRDLSDAGSTLRERGDTMPARVSETVGRRLTDFGSYMESRSGDEVLRDAQNVARRNVWAFAVGGLVLGFTAARMLGAAMRHDDSQQRLAQQQYPAQPVLTTGQTVETGQQTWPSEYRGPVVVPSDEDRYGTGTSGVSYG